MRLTVLGSGTIHPNRDRRCASYLVESGDFKVLMDMGPGSLLGMGQAGIDALDLNGILITHRHADHCCELAWLLQLLRSRGRTRSLKIAAPIIFKEYLDFYRKWGRDASKPDPFTVNFTAVPGILTWEGMEIEGLSVPHVEHSVGFRIRCDGRTLAYTGDTGPGPQLSELARQADLLVAECTLPKGSTSKVHLNPEQVAQFANSAGAKKVLLSHFPPGADTATAQNICRDSGLDTIVARDGIQVELL